MNFRHHYNAKKRWRRKHLYSATISYFMLVLCLNSDNNIKLPNKISNFESYLISYVTHSLSVCHKNLYMFLFFSFFFIEEQQCRIWAILYLHTLSSHASHNFKIVIFLSVFFSLAPSWMAVLWHPRTLGPKWATFNELI